MPMNASGALSLGEELILLISSRNLHAKKLCNDCIRSHVMGTSYCTLLVHRSLNKYRQIHHPPPSTPSVTLPPNPSQNKSPAPLPPKKKKKKKRTKRQLPNCFLLIPYVLGTHTKRASLSIFFPGRL